ncbi:hypothetical protein B0J18DRAFT_277146 [Chaetomium sp. MPI-SDFR-AT-0129]|nr:hypothetical protein B0J18DRAFT_277146 [Chaetomium sp. MPI-SDFR-AT-0129]
MGSLASDFLAPAAFVEQVAAETPDKVWAKYPEVIGKSDSIRPEIAWRDITWSQLSRAVEFTARWLEQELGPGNGEEPVAYTAVNDFRYPVVVMAALKAGYKSFLISPRNSLEGNVSLLNATQCAKFVHSVEFQGMVNGLAQATPNLQTAQIPEVADIFSAAEGTTYQDRGSNYLEDQETFVILHSSGSTGLPKPIYLKGGIFRVGAESLSMPAPEGRTNVHISIIRSELLLCTMPFFHVYGIMMLFNRSLYNQGPLTILPPGRPPTADLVLHALEQVQPRSAVFPPSLLEDIINIPGGLEKLGKLDGVYYGGAPLAKAIGDKITRVTQLVNTIGSTETFNFPNLNPVDPADWEYFEWNPLVGIEMEPTAEEGVAELVIKRQPGNPFQSVFHNFPDVDEYRPHDLYQQHPTKPALWKYIGRADDIIVLRNGEKTNPVSFEKAVEGHPWVKGAIVVGTAQLQAGLILEPQPEQAHLALEVFLNEVWPTVEAANAESPAHAQVWRTMVVLASPEKPFKRAPKGSIIRKATNALYEDEIMVLYEGPAETAGSQGKTGLLNNNQLRTAIKQAVQSVMAGRAGELTDDANLFKLGADSLQVMQIRQALSAAGINCPTRAVYENPSINLLVRALGNGADNAAPTITISREEKMSAMIHRYTKFAPRATESVKPDSTSAVLLVGSTGALGTHLLYELLRNPAVERVYCLNRSDNAAERQVQAFADRGLDIPDVASHPKVRFLTGETRHENFGLSPTDYADMQSDVNTIIINAWPVNFNSTLDSFEDVIAGVKRCVDFAAGSARRAHIGFVSSVASVLNFPAVRSREGDEVLVVPEEFEADNSLPARQGYGESKHVASSILAKAVKEGVVGGTVLRVGQLAGTAEAKGVWNRHEWLPSLIKTSKSLGKIPRSLGPSNDNIIWVPVDTAAKVITEFLPIETQKEADSTPASLNCFNVMNPQVTQWADLAKTVQDFYVEQGNELISVEFDEWLSDLRSIDAAQTPEQVAKFPAVKILDFYEGLRLEADIEGPELAFATKKGSARSSAMAGLRSLEGDLMRKWLVEWEF